MFIKICLLIIGLVVGVFGFISASKEKDQEQKKIYLIAGTIGIVIAVVFALSAFVF